MEIQPTRPRVVLLTDPIIKFLSPEAVARPERTDLEPES